MKNTVYKCFIKKCELNWKSAATLCLWAFFLQSLRMQCGLKFENFHGLVCNLVRKL